jgi:hypothetical protein
MVIRLAAWTREGNIWNGREVLDLCKEIFYTARNPSRKVELKLLKHWGYCHWLGDGEEWFTEKVKRDKRKALILSRKLLNWSLEGGEAGSRSTSSVCVNCSSNFITHNSILRSLTDINILKLCYRLRSSQDLSDLDKDPAWSVWKLFLGVLSGVWRRLKVFMRVWRIRPNNNSYSLIEYPFFKVFQKRKKK